jgi:hypothetical protein
MNTSREWLISYLNELHAKGGAWAVSLYLLLATCLLPAITACLLVGLIALTYLVLGLSILQALDWMLAKLFTRNKTRSSNAEM